MAGKDQAPIIIKRKIVSGGGGHHGGAWKVAYADFVTAMMAFFLLMWLLNATSDDQKRGLADYFDPSIPIARNSAGGAGMLSGDSVNSPERVAGTRQEGARPRPTHQEPGRDLGDQGASAPHAEQDLPDSTVDGGGQAAKAAAEAADAALQATSSALREAMSELGDGSIAKNFNMRMTPEGLVLELVDAEDAPLFAAGSAASAARLEMLMSIVAPVLDQTTNPIAVVGHTDAAPFERDGYGNWELSSDRANAARRLLIGAGLGEERIVRVSGKAATDPLLPDALAPQNRRIAITLLREPAR